MAKKQPAAKVQDNSGQEPQLNFEERLAYYTNELSSKFTENGVNNAVIIINDPKFNKPMISIVGHKYDATVLIAHVYKIFKQMIDEETNANNSG